ncbi:hypothetical protein GN956_G20379 [Arapaima gigas]
MTCPELAAVLPSNVRTSLTSVYTAALLLTVFYSVGHTPRCPSDKTKAGKRTITGVFCSRFKASRLFGTIHHWAALLYLRLCPPLLLHLPAGSLRFSYNCVDRGFHSKSLVDSRRLRVVSGVKRLSYPWKLTEQILIFVPVSLFSSRRDRKIGHTWSTNVCRFTWRKGDAASQTAHLQLSKASIEHNTSQVKPLQPFTHCARYEK